MGRGSIVAISSISGLIGNRGQANYAAAKSGPHGAAKSLALEVASRGVTVSVVAPGIIDTEDTMRALDAAAIERLVRMQRAGAPEAVAGLVGYLVSDAAAYVTGMSSRWAAASTNPENPFSETAAPLEDLAFVIQSAPLRYDGDPR